MTFYLFHYSHPYLFTFSNFQLQCKYWLFEYPTYEPRSEKTEVHSMRFLAAKDQHILSWWRQVINPNLQLWEDFYRT